jgi:ABC-2 type transport system permease protein
MNRLVLVRKTLRDVRISTLTVAAAVFLMAFFDLLVYPQYRDQIKDFQIPDFMKGMLGQVGEYASPAGFLQTEFFSWIPLLLVTVAIIGATGTLAGEESAGTLESLLALPITRVRLLLEKALGLTIAIVLCALVALPGFLLALLFVGIDLSMVRVLLAVLNMLPLVLLFLTLTLWAAAALPSRGAAAAVSIGAVVVTYFLNLMGAAVPLLETPRKLSPFYWSDASRILLYGFHEWTRLVGLLGCAALFLGLALWSFSRRDITSGAREWRLRPRIPGIGQRPTAQQQPAA